MGPAPARRLPRSAAWLGASSASSSPQRSPSNGRPHPAPAPRPAAPRAAPPPRDARRDFRHAAAAATAGAHWPDSPSLCRCPGQPRRRLRAAFPGWGPAGGRGSAPPRARGVWGEFRASQSQGRGAGPGAEPGELSSRLPDRKTEARWGRPRGGSGAGLQPCSFDSGAGL